MARFGETLQSVLQCVDSSGAAHEVQVLKVQPVSRMAHGREYFAAEDVLIYQLADGRRVEQEPSANSGEMRFRISGTDILLRRSS